MIRVPFRKREADPWQPVAPLPDARTYVSHGDNLWGCAVVFRPLEDDATKIQLHGWIQPRPRVGDWCMRRMTQGWGYFIITEVELCRDPYDMFFAKARGVVRYAEEDEIPKTKAADEFLQRLGGEWALL